MILHLFPVAFFPFGPDVLWLCLCRRVSLRAACLPPNADGHTIFTLVDTRMSEDTVPVFCGLGGPAGHGVSSQCA